MSICSADFDLLRSVADVRQQYVTHDAATPTPPACLLAMHGLNEIPLPRKLNYNTLSTMFYPPTVSLWPHGAAIGLVSVCTCLCVCVRK